MSADPRGELIRDYLTAVPNPDAALDEYRNIRTEGGNELTKDLSGQAVRDMPAALKSILDVEAEALEAFRGLSDEVAKIKAAVDKAKESGKKVYLVGCGASGRMAVLIEHMMLAQDKDNASWFKAALAGGDVALVDAVEGAEDSATAARDQLGKQEYTAGDVVIGFSASGSATFVQQAVNFAEENAPGSSLFVTCNDADAVRAKATKNGFSKLAEASVEISALKIPSLAITGSSRLTPTTVMTKACASILAESADPSALIDRLSAINFDALAELTNFEANAYLAGERVTYELNISDLSKVSFFTDITERNPTFNLPRIGSIRDLAAKLDKGLEPWCWPIFSGCKNVIDAWHRLLQRPPVCLNLSKGREEKHDGDVPVDRSTLDYLSSCDFSEDAGGKWTQQMTDKGKILKTITVTESDTGFLFEFGDKTFELNTVGLSPFDTQLLLKAVLNAHSSACMAKNNLCFGNVMTNLSPTNIKLIARAELQLQSIFENSTLEQLELTEAQKARYSRAVLREQLLEIIPVLQPNQSVVTVVKKRYLAGLRNEVSPDAVVLDWAGGASGAAPTPAPEGI